MSLNKNRTNTNILCNKHLHKMLIYTPFLRVTLYMYLYKEFNNNLPQTIDKKKIRDELNITIQFEIIHCINSRSDIDLYINENDASLFSLI